MGCVSVSSVELAGGGSANNAVTQSSFMNEMAHFFLAHPIIKDIVVNGGVVKHTMLRG